MPTLEIARPATPCPIPLFRGGDIAHPERAIAQGDLIRIRHGVYAPAALWDALPPWERYATRVHAVALLYPDAVFCLESAASLLGMPVFGDPVEVHVLVRSTTPARLVAGVRTHKSGRERHLIQVAGLTMTSRADTTVDIARHRHNAIGLATADAALRSGRDLTKETLLALNEARASSRGRNLARWPLSRCSPLAETAFESVSRAVIEWLGFPTPELQVPFRTTMGPEDRTDFLWRKASVVGEADGDLKYDGRFGDPRTILRRQTVRDGRLRRQVRAVTHWGWTDATAITPLRDILLGSGLEQTYPEDSARLYSLRRLLAPRAPHLTTRP